MISHALSSADAESGRMINRTFVKWAVLGTLFALCLYLTLALYAQQQFAFAILFLVVTSAALYVFSSPGSYAHRYIFPSVAGMVVFVVFPLVYTVGIGFTNYSAAHLLTFDRVKQYFLAQTFQQPGSRYNFTAWEATGGWVLELVSAEGIAYRTEPVVLDQEKAGERPAGVRVVRAMTVDEPSLKPGRPLKLKDVIARKKALAQVEVHLPDDKALRMAGLRHFAALQPLYTELEGERLRNNETGEILVPNHEEGFYQKANGEYVTPGWTVTIGWANYARVLTDPSIREPFTQIFLWTVSFAFLSVVFTLALGLVLANLLQWDQMTGKAFYRMMLILPYAVPAFISILVFKGLFNQNFGEINLILEKLFGIRPDWFSDPALARTMILIVNTWLGFPYMMLLCMGLLQSIPRDLYEASAIDGATPLDNLWRITLPLIIRPLMPLLIASFAFNFNNFVLIALLTGGAPDIIGASTPAGTTDLLVSYTYRIAFQDSGQNFGLAAAIATVIFLIVGGLSWLNLKLTKVKV